MVALEFGDVDAALARRDHVFDDVFFYRREHASAARAARPRRALTDPDGKLVVYVEHADAALCASRAGESARDAGRAYPRHRDAQRRRLRREERSVQPRGRRRPRRRCILDRPVKITLTREEVFYCHRGRHPVLMQVPHGREERRHAHRRAPADAARRRRVRIVRRREHVLHRRAADGDVPRAALQVPTAAACSRTSRRAAPSAGTARRRAASGRKSSSTRSPSALGIDPGGPPPADRRAAEFADRELPARRDDRARRSASVASSARSGWTRAASASCRSRPRARSRVLVVSVRRRAANLLERHAALGACS